jgi:uncharacterized phage protein (TIGR01671 family)
MEETKQRQIKFRGKSYGKKMWYYGSIIQWKDGDIYICHNEQNETLYKIYAIPETVGQFTGLCDKNGVEVYENDFVRAEKYNPEIYLVEFIQGGFCCTHKNDFFPIDISHFYPSCGCEFEVIGNIFDNKELLKNE